MDEGMVGALAVAGGGTGGHLFPGLAIAREFQKRNSALRVLYIGVEGKMEEHLVPAAGFGFLGLSMRGLKGQSPGRVASGALLAARAVGRCRRALRDFGPDLMVGVGGYSSGPAVLAARTLGVPVVLQEQNTVPGLTNRLLGRWAQRICIAFEEAAPFFPAGRAVLTGNPIREDAFAEPHRVGTGEELRVLVLGGSRGAAGLNRMISLALAQWKEMGLPARFVHQAGAEDRDRVERAYGEAGFRAEVRTFLDNPREKYLWADLAVSRAGAGAVSEIAAAGLPALFVPFPHAAGGHQEKNARWLVDRGGALLVREGEQGAPEKLARLLAVLAADRGRLRRMAEESRKVGIRDSAERIVDECLSLLNLQRG